MKIRKMEVNSFLDSATVELFSVAHPKDVLTGNDGARDNNALN